MKAETLSLHDPPFRAASVAFFYLLAFTVFTASDDWVLVVRIGGFPLRASLVALALVLVFAGFAWLAAMAHGSRAGSGRVDWRVDAAWSLPLLAVGAWNFFITLFGPMAGSTRGLFYAVLIAMVAIAMWLLPRTWPGPAAVRSLLSVYAWSALLLSAFALFQWGVGWLGWDLLLAQRFRDGMPRANGISYEPAYFALYMLGALPLVLQRATLDRRWLTGSILVVTAIALSTSRLGGLLLLALLALALVRPWPGVRRFDAGVLLALSVSLYVVLPYLSEIPALGSKTSPATSEQAIGQSSAAPTGESSAAPTGESAGEATDETRPPPMLDGFGIQGGSTSSVDVKTDNMRLTWAVFLDHPIAGVGMGGLDQAVQSKVGKQREHRYNLFYGGANILLEALAAHGIVGTLLLLFAVGSLAWAACRSGPEGWALTLGLGAMLAALLANQNLWRMSVIVHLILMAMLVLAAAHRTDPANARSARTAST